MFFKFIKRATGETVGARERIPLSRLAPPLSAFLRTETVFAFLAHYFRAAGLEGRSRLSEITLKIAATNGILNCDATLWELTRLTPLFPF